jgi:hypothetical protein
MTADMLATIARVRRAMPRNPDVMAICDVAERSLVQSKSRSDASDAPKAQRGRPDAEGAPTSGFDRKA